MLGGVISSYSLRPKEITGRGERERGNEMSSSLIDREREREREQDGEPTLLSSSSSCPASSNNHSYTSSETERADHAKLVSRLSSVLRRSVLYRNRMTRSRSFSRKGGWGGQRDNDAPCSRGQLTLNGLTQP
jgi:hypothetical protein